MKEEVNMLTKNKIKKALDAFYWGDTGPNAKDEYTSGYKLLHKDEDTINVIGEVLHTLIEKGKYENNNDISHGCINNIYS